MVNPAARAPLYCRRLSASYGDVLDHLHEWIGQLGKVCRFSKPIVHLGIDVDRVFAAPGRRHEVVPYTLQVGRLCSRTRTGDQQVAGELKIESDKLRIVSRGKSLNALISRHSHCLAGT